MGGSISPQCFMTDDAEQYHNGWKVFGERNTRKNLCAWHVDQAWRKALLQHIGERENQVHVYISSTSVITY